MVKVYQEIRLHDLSTSEVQDMLESLLKTETIPTDLRRFVQDKAEGNPFYLEELVNSLIESEILVSDDGNWRLTGPIREADVSSTIHGIISGRLDRLEQETKRVLQEASVIGRTFYYEILSKITELKANVDQCLSNLERLDLIKAKSLEPDLEYIFKHALTQEVVYNGLLKTERNGIHERIALVMEQLFHDRLPEFYETLAFHFSRGKSLLKAVEYLMKSGEKSLKHYAVEESHQYYEEAFGLLNKKIDTSKEENKVLIDLLIQWAYVFFYRGDFRSLNDLFTTHKGLAESLDDDAKLGMFYGWLGFSLYLREKLEDSYQILSKAYELGEQTENLKVMGYACAWLTWPCAELGLLEQGIRFGKKALGIARTLEFDHHLFFQCLSGMGEIYFYGGESKESIDHGRILLNYGKKYSNLRSFVMGHLCVGNGYFIAGDLLSAIESYKRAIKLSVDPFYSQWVTLFLGMSKLGNGEFQEAEEILSGVVSFSENFGCECIGTPALGLLGFALIGKGLMSRGIRIMEEAIQSFAQNRRRPLIAFGAYYRGKLYSQLAEGAEQISLAIMAKNIRFLVKNVPFATKKAEAHFDEAIEMAKEIGAKGVLGRAYLDLGLLHKAKKRTERAKECISKSIQIFEQCEAEIYLKQAREALE
jgi:tetratricopeptide (TPR) repeat protein